MTRRHIGFAVAAAGACGLAGFTPGLSVQAADRMIVTPIEEARFVPIDPARPDGAQVSVLWGDPAQGPSAMYLRFKKGAGVLHRHTSDYHLVVLQGTMKHWSGDQKEAQAPPLGPGSYWFQPGQQAHADSCLTDECLMFVKWEGKRDGVAVDAPR